MGAVSERREHLSLIDVAPPHTAQWGINLSCRRAADRRIGTALTTPLKNQHRIKWNQRGSDLTGQSVSTSDSLESRATHERQQVRKNKDSTTDFAKPMAHVILLTEQSDP